MLTIIVELSRNFFFFTGGGGGVLGNGKPLLPTPLGEVPFLHATLAFHLSSGYRTPTVIRNVVVFS